MSAQPSLLYRFLRLLVIPGLVYYLVLVVDLFIHPLHLLGLFDPRLETAVYLFCGLVVAPGTILTGLYLVRRVPGNVVGLILFYVGVGTANSVLGSTENQIFRLFFEFSLLLTFRPLAFLAFYFPTGRVYPERYHRVVDVWAVITVLVAAFAAFAHPDHNLLGGPNPLFIPALAPVYDILWNGLTISLGLSFLLGVISLFLRYRSAPETERLQIRWLFAGVISLCAILFSWTPLIDILKPPLNNYYLLIQIYVYAFPTLAIGSAILRHRLWDIDIIIRRTLVYSILTTILGAIYFGGVVLLQRLFQAVVGQTPDAAIVISTLLIFVLFSPIRRRVQDTIDRRFYRRKYDAEKTLARFNQTLRDEVDIETLKDSLVSVVQETMQPTHIALWTPETPPK